MGGKNKNKPNKPQKPYAQWEVAQHIITQTERKGFTYEWRDITTGAVEVVAKMKHGDKCRVCGETKFFFFSKDKPTDGKRDYKLIGCRKCALFITVYLNERTHGNTPIHDYQIRQGMTSYPLPPCVRCGYRGIVTTEHKTQEQVDKQFEHECKGRR